MSAPQDNEDWIERARALLDHSAEAIDASTLSRLNRMRQAALAQHRVARPRWTIGAALAGAAAIVFGVAFGLNHRFGADPVVQQTASLQAEDIDVLTSDALRHAVARSLSVQPAALLVEVFGRRHDRLGRVLSILGGLGLLTGSACTRFGIFEAGLESAKDPKYTVIPQRERLEANESAE